MGKKKQLSVTVNILWNTIGNVIYLGTQWVTTIIIAQTVGYEQLGIFSLAMSISNVGFSIAGWGIRNYQVSDINYKYDESVYIMARFITCFFSYICIFIFGSLQDYSFIQQLALNTYMLFRIGESLIDVIHGIFQQRERMDYVGASFIIRGILNLLVLILLLNWKHDIILGITGIVISTISVMIMWDYRKLTHLGVFLLTPFFHFTQKNFKNSIYSCFKKTLSLIFECSPLAIQHVLFTSYATIPRFFLERLLGQETLGIYSSITTPVVIIQAMANFIMIPYTTVITKCVHLKQRKLLIKNMFLILGIISGFGILFSAVMLLVGEKALYLLFGTEVAKEAGVLLPTTIAVIFVAFDSFLNIILIVFRQKKGLLVANFCSVLTAYLSAELLINRFGLYGASYVHISTLLMHFIITLLFSIIEIRKISPCNLGKR